MSVVSTKARDGGLATSSGNSTLTDSTKSWTTTQWQNWYVQIVAGTGTGEWARITANTATQLTISGTWAQNPDTTSQYQISPFPPGTVSLN